MADEGGVLGIDLSAEAIALARELAQAEGARNVTFEHGDAQVYPFLSERFEVAISRFGTMFFSDPVAAFANIARSLRSAGRLVMMVWQGHEQNEWSVSIEEALGGAGRDPLLASEGPDPFSLSDPVIVEEILRRTGFTEVDFAEVRQPIYFGRDIAAALGWVQGFAATRAVLAGLGPASAQRALDRLRETLAAHTSGGGVWFDSRAWIVTARAPR